MMTRMIAGFFSLSLVLMLGAPVVRAQAVDRAPVLVTQLAQAAEAAPPQATPKPPAAQDEFVPISEIPEHDKLPAAPFLIAAYTFVWLAFLGYVWTLWRRLSRVEEELKRVASSAPRP
jgi:CcmD family protein